jgi:hypothetical protein
LSRGATFVDTLAGAIAKLDGLELRGGQYCSVDQALAPKRISANRHIQQPTKVHVDLDHALSVGRKKLI